MSYSYYFLLGQNINFLSIDWKISLFINTFLAVIIVCCDNFRSLKPLSLLVGWASCLIINKTQIAKTSTFQWTVMANIYIIMHTTEIAIFGMMTLFVFENDGNSILWLIIIVSHVLYIISIYLLNIHFERIEHVSTKLNYYVVYGIMLITSDLFFLFHDVLSSYRYIPFSFVFITAVITFLLSFIIYEHAKSVHQQVDDSVFIPI